MDKNRETEVGQSISQTDILKVINQLAEVVQYLSAAIDGLSFPFRNQVNERVETVISNIEKLHGGRLDYPRKGYYQ